MRFLFTLLLAALLVLGVWTFVDYETFLMGPSPEGYTWWWPSEVSTYGQDIDFLFNLIAFMVLVPLSLLIQGIFLILMKGQPLRIYQKWSSLRNQ